MLRYSNLPAALILLSTCGHVVAADYSTGFDFGLNAIYDDNFRLTEDDEITISGAEANSKIFFDVNTEIHKLNLNGRLRSQRFDENQFNTDDQFASASYRYQLERSAIGLNADFVHDSTNTSEIESSGRISNKAERHDRYTLLPSWTYQLTENDSVSLNGRYSKDEYDNDAYTGYEYWDTNIDWSHLINERWSLLARVSLTNFETEDRTLSLPYFLEINFFGSPLLVQAGVAEQTTVTKTRSHGFLVGTKYAWTEQQSISLMVGNSRQETNYSLTDPENICGQYISALCAREDQRGREFTSDISWQWKNERQQFELSLRKATQPTSNGQAVDQTQLTGSWSYALTELQKIRFIIQGVRNRELDDSEAQTASFSQLNRNYGSAALEYNYRLTEEWLLTSNYRYRFQEYPDYEIKANAQTITLGIRYQPQSWHWSR